MREHDFTAMDETVIGLLLECRNVLKGMERSYSRPKAAIGFAATMRRAGR
jgi:hypothetical protein